MKKRITAKCSPSHEPDLMRGRMLLDKMSMDTDGNVVQLTYDELRLVCRGLSYEGDEEHGIPHGTGRLTEPGGRVWSGEFSRGKLLHGAMVGADSRYVGDFLNLEPHGEGRFANAAGLVFSGLFRHGYLVNGTYGKPGQFLYEGSLNHKCFHGKGKLTRIHGGKEDVAEGLFENGDFRNGVYTRLDGSVEEGEFRDFVLHGEGRRTCPDGHEYSGGFRGGKRHGRGIQVDPTTGRVCDGDWRDDTLVTGEISQDGLKYQGQMTCSVPGGTGRLESGGTAIEGTFDGFAVSGECQLTCSSGDCLELLIRKTGQIELRCLRDDRWEWVPSSENKGHATLRSPEGHAYSGAVRHGRAHGAGDLVIPGVGTCKGTFSSGVLEGPATVLFASGASLNGTFRGGLLNGPGEYRSASGMVYIGRFRDGFACGPGALFTPGGDGHMLLMIEDGLFPSMDGIAEADILDLGEALADFPVGFPRQAVLDYAVASGKGVFVRKVVSGPLPDGCEPFVAREVPFPDAHAEVDGGDLAA